jgi:hypothetical protein
MQYDLKIKKSMTVAQREELDRQFYSHIAETKKERAQYAKDKIKGMEYGMEELSPSKERLVLILDAIDKWKTTFPFFINLPKVLGDGLYFSGLNCWQLWCMALVFSVSGPLNNLYMTQTL